MMVYNVQKVILQYYCGTVVKHEADIAVAQFFHKYAQKKAVQCKRFANLLKWWLTLDVSLTYEKVIRQN